MRTLHSARRRACVILLVWWTAVLTGCGTPEEAPPAHSPKPPTVLRVAGAGVMGAELVPAVAESFLKTYLKMSDVYTRAEAEPGLVVVAATPPGGGPPVHIVIDEAGTSDAVAALTANSANEDSADVVMSARELGQDERRQLGPDPIETVIARDGVVAVVHPTNPVTRLTLDQLGALYSCRVTDWSGVGGRAGQVRLLTTVDQPNPWDVVGRAVVHAADLCPGTQRLADDRALADEVAADPSAIALVSDHYVAGTKPVALGDGPSAAVAASPETIRSGAYPLIRRLALYTLADGPGLAKQFVDFATSDAGQRAVSAARFTGPPAPPCTGLAGYCAFIGGATRVPVSLWFAFGRSTLDARGRADVDNAREYLRNRTPRAKKVLVVGFADDIGTDAANLDLSRQRAATVAEQLAASGLPIEHRGFGEIAGSSSVEARDVERRVEVWLTS
jgi:phosphate transport system substrate-binding protein